MRFRPFLTAVTIFLASIASAVASQPVVSGGDSLTIVMSGAIATTNPTWSVDSVDLNRNAKSNAVGSTNGVTAVTLITGTVPTQVTSISVTNIDTAAVTITLKKVVSSTGYTLAVQTLQVGDTLTLDGNGLRVTDTNGQLKNSNGTISGQLTLVPGASTAAAGTTTADAGVLPAATSSVYPTTAADDTKGVRVNAADKVTGRTLLIGNGTSNKILKVYAPSGGTINGGSADAAFSSASGKGVTIYCLSGSGNTWLAW